ncbi:MAG: RdgB/HAM1 family non-canonical purine NTP pyrophosphatase [Oscillospiraceae bacterium]
MIVIAATKNNGKLKELNRVMSDYDITLISMKDAEIAVEIVEDGITFEENALIKARTLHKITGKPVISDDSGICVNCLDGRPGVYSARYGGEDLPYPEKMQKLIDEIAAKNTTDRSAYYSCVIVYIDKDSKEYIFNGRCDGKIGYEPKGDSGFGYDPIFVVGEKTMAEMTDEEKDEISHRGKALRLLANNLPEIIKNAE